MLEIKGDARSASLRGGPRHALCSKRPRGGAKRVSAAPQVGTHRVHATGSHSQKRKIRTMRFSALALITAIGATGLAAFTPRIALAQG